MTKERRGDNEREETTTKKRGEETTKERRGDDEREERR